MRWLALLLAVLLGLAGCSTAPPPGLTAVTPFDVNRYAGKWYEIARMDHSFERGLSDVSATYTLQPDGSVWTAGSTHNPAELTDPDEVERFGRMGSCRGKKAGDCGKGNSAHEDS